MISPQQWEQLHGIDLTRPVQSTSGSAASQRRGAVPLAADFGQAQYVSFVSANVATGQELFRTIRERRSHLLVHDRFVRQSMLQSIRVQADSQTQFHFPLTKLAAKKLLETLYERKHQELRIQMQTDLSTEQYKLLVRQLLKDVDISRTQVFERMRLCRQIE